MVKKYIAFLILLWLIIGLYAHIVINDALTERVDFIVPSVSNEINKEKRLDIICNLPDSVWYIVDENNEKLNIEISQNLKWRLSYNEDFCKGMFYRISETDSCIIYHYRRCFNIYQMYCYYDFLTNGVEPLEVIYPESMLEEFTDEVILPFDRLNHKFLGYYKKDPWMMAGIPINSDFSKNKYELVYAYIYIPAKAQSCYYCFSGSTISDVIENNTLFKGNYNNYAVQINADIDPLIKGEKIIENDEGTICYYPELNNKPIIEEMVCDPYRPNTYRVIGTIKGVNKIHGFTLYDDDSIFVNANALVKDAYQRGLINTDLQR